MSLHCDTIQLGRIILFLGFIAPLIHFKRSMSCFPCSWVDLVDDVINKNSYTMSLLIIQINSIINLSALIVNIYLSNFGEECSTYSAILI